MTTAQSSEFLSPREIAAWQIPSVSRGISTVHAELPALQRGAVWQARQVEALWDSVFRGFPIGAFLLAPFQAERGHKDFRYQPKDITGPQATHHLLDGQQRSNALTLGFLNPWSTELHETPPATLWIDLQHPKRNDERDFVLRLLTRSHPWGYRYDPLASDGPRLAAPMIRDAVTAFEKATPSLGGESGGQIPLTHSWPWDAFAPVPLCFLLEAVDNGDDVRTNLQERLSQLLPFWKSDVRNYNGNNWQKRVTAILKASSGSDFEYMARLICRVRGVLGKDEASSYRIAALVVPNLTAVLSEEVPRKASPTDQAEQQDAVETLFIRINSGGTPLVGEELIYSILKSIWPDAEGFIQEMDVRLASPSRIVNLASRLVLSDAAAFQEVPPAPPTVARFRRLVHGVDRECRNFQNRLLAFFGNDKVNAKRVFQATRDLLINNNRCDLPPTLAAEIARRSPNVLFLLLRWVQRMLEEGHDTKELNNAATLRLLGAVTALSWFADDDGRCLTALWTALQSAKGMGLQTFFSSQRFVKSFKRTGSRFGLLPLVPPDILDDAIESNLFGHGFNKPVCDLWVNWNWDNLTERSLEDRRLGKKLHRWYKRSFKKQWEHGDQFEEGAGEEDIGSQENFYQQAWRLFINKLSDEKSLILFAQREFGSFLGLQRPNTTRQV